MSRKGLHALPHPWRNAGSSLLALVLRSFDNLTATWRIVLNRQARRPALYPRLALWPASWALLVTLIGAVLLLDLPLASFRREWPADTLRFAEITTVLGLSGWYLVPAVILLVIVNLTDWHGRSRRGLLVLYNWTCLGFFALASVGLSGIAVNVFKYSIGRARPQHLLDPDSYAFSPFAMEAYYASFPSGHSTTMGAVAGILWLFFPRWRFLIVPVTVWCAATRAVVGAHFASDVVAGLAFGFAATMLTAIVFARLGYIFKQQSAGLPKVKKTFREFW